MLALAHQQPTTAAWRWRERCVDWSPVHEWVTEHRVVPSDAHKGCWCPILATSPLWEPRIWTQCSAVLTPCLDNRSHSSSILHKLASSTSSKSICSAIFYTCRCSESSLNWTELWGGNHNMIIMCQQCNTIDYSYYAPTNTVNTGVAHVWILSDNTIDCMVVHVAVQSPTHGVGHVLFIAYIIH